MTWVVFIWTIPAIVLLVRAGWMKRDDPKEWWQVILAVTVAALAYFSLETIVLAEHLRDTCFDLQATMGKANPEFDGDPGYYMPRRCRFISE